MQSHFHWLSFASVAEDKMRKEFGAAYLPANA